MKQVNGKTIEDARNILKTLLAISIVCCVCSLLFAAEGSPLQVTLILISLAMIGGCFFVVFKYCRCPSCGKVILMGVLRETHCPRCKRNLITGKKGKRK